MGKRNRIKAAERKNASIGLEPVQIADHEAVHQAEATLIRLGEEPVTATLEFEDPELHARLRAEQLERLQTDIADHARAGTFARLHRPRLDAALLMGAITTEAHARVIPRLSYPALGHDLHAARQLAYEATLFADPYWVLAQRLQSAPLHQVDQATGAVLV